MKCALVFRKPVVENLVTWLACSTPRHTFFFFWRGRGERGTKRVLEKGAKTKNPETPLFTLYLEENSSFWSPWNPWSGDAG